MWDTRTGDRSELVSEVLDGRIKSDTKIHRVCQRSIYENSKADDAERVCTWTICQREHEGSGIDKWLLHTAKQRPIYVLLWSRNLENNLTHTLLRNESMTVH